MRSRLSNVLSINDPARRAEILAACTRVFGHPPKGVRERLLELAEAADATEKPDRYGGGTLLEDFEARIAALLGKEAAVFMPSGTMAQQIALRLHAGQTHNSLVALHPRSHLVVSEEDAYQRLSGLHGLLVGDRNKLFALEDLLALRERPGTLLIELPERGIGGALRPWDELLAMAQWARQQGIRMHLDGARLWESQPYYDRTHAHICALFDTVYVSFYKILNGIAGAALAGPKTIIDEARVWQQRHGGRLVQLYPYVISARDGLTKYLPRIAAYRERALHIAAVLSEFDEIEVTPNPPPTNMMHVYLRGDAEKLDAAMLQVAQEHGVRLFPSLTSTPVPDQHMFELTVGEGAFEIGDDELRTFFGRVLA